MTVNTESHLIAGTWTIDPSHSEVGFTVRHLMTKVRGQFESFEGKVVTGTSVAETKAEASIDLNSINTRDAQRDGHLRSSDFFDVEKTGPMTFTSTAFDGTTATGDLTIKGVTRPVTLDVEFLGLDADAYGGQRIGFEATTEINRKDFGIDFNIPLDGGRFVIGDKVSITLSVQAVLDQDA
ncbi:YceI family protein [Nocardioides speluncae]|uniref:YceI family protein n=1 Tax=Nocardioides speluncae TaxID=2670337 RepID=UPI000D69F7E7|nr:YceI family protein [Nocardioides speluncae]